MSTPASGCVVPFEIVELVIDLFAEENDKSSLKAISLVCRSVLPRCRKYLFSKLAVDDYLVESKERSRILLSPQTDIPKYIRRLDYSIPHAASQSLERISFLQRLTLRYSDDPTAYDWNHMDPSLQSTLLNLMRLPTLTHLHLISIHNLPVSALLSCTSVEHLQLDDVGVTDEESTTCTLLPSGLSISTVSRIREYTFRQSAVATMRLLTAKLVDGRLAVDFRKLKRLSVTFETIEDVKATQSLLKEFKQAEELCVRVNDYSPGGLTGLAETGFHTFGKTLCLYLSAREFNAQHGLFLQLCNGISAMATTNNTLEDLKLDIHAREILSRGEWEELDTVLSGWPCLKHVSFDIKIWGSRVTWEDMKLLMDLPDTQLRQLAKRESLNFEFSARRAPCPWI